MFGWCRHWGRGEGWARWGLVAGWLLVWTAALAGTEEEVAPGQLAVGRNADGRLELFNVDDQGVLRHRWQRRPGGDWTSWADLGGNLLPGVAAASNSDGSLEVFAVDRATRALVSIRQKSTNGLWTGWNQLGGKVQAPVAVGQNLDGHLEVLAVQVDGTGVSHRWQTGPSGEWSAWEPLERQLLTGPAVGRNRDGRLELFGVDPGTHALVHCAQTAPNASGSWSGWSGLRGAVLPGLAVGQNAAGGLEVFAVNRLHGGVSRIYQLAAAQDGGWSPWQDLRPAQVQPGLALGQNADGRLEVFALQQSGSGVLHAWQLQPTVPEKWSAWSELGGQIRPGLAAERNLDGSLELFALEAGQSATALHKRQISTNSTWLDWFSLDQPFFQYATRTWQTEDGLPNSVVQAIAQTPDGSLWVGTHNGLARFDGLRFAIYDEKNTPEILNPYITSLCVDRAGTLWIGSYEGLIRLQDGVFSRFDKNNGLAGNYITVLCPGQNGALWIGTLTGLSCFQEGRFVNYTRKEGLVSEVIRGLYEDRTAHLWISTPAGLNRWGTGRMEAFTKTNGLPENSLRGLCEDQGGRVWIGSDSGLIWSHRDGRVFAAYGRQYGLSDNSVNVVCEDREGNLWVGTYNGLNRFREGRFFEQRTGAGFHQVSAFFEDREGSLWVGSKEGLTRLTPKRFFALNQRHGLSHNNTVSVLEDREGSLWAATWGGGLNRIRDEQVLAYSQTQGLANDLSLAICEGRDGSLWIGADYDGGLTRLKDGTFEHYTWKEGLPKAAVRVLHEDRAGRLWIGTSHGLSCFSQGRFTNFTTKENLAGDIVTSICEDHAGQLWIGTWGGLSRWDKGHFVNFTARDGLSDNVVLALYEDKEHALWIGTGSGGLNCYRAGRFSACSSRQGLFSDEIYEILEDDYGWLWMSCWKGIFRVRKQDLEALDCGRLQTLTSFSYGEADGLESTLCSGVAKPSGWKARDGRLWFATSKGLVAVDPNIRIDQAPPPVSIEELLADRQPLSRSAVGLPSGQRLGASPLVIPPGRGELEFHYTAINLQAPEKVRFRYKLEGLDEDWVQAGSHRIAHYHNVYPGQYRFRVQACSAAGVWNEAGACLPLELRPHVWQTWWCRSLAGLALVGTVGGSARYLTRRRLQRRLEWLEREHAIEKERARIAKDIHDEIGSSLTRILLLGQRTREQVAHPEKLALHAAKIVHSAVATIQSLDEIVWAVDPKKDTLEGLVGYLNQFANEFFDDSPIRCRLEMPECLAALTIPAEVRHDLFLVVKEALNNVLKHSGASEVRVRLTEAAATVTITIADNGRGFDPVQVPGGGNGLENMRKRLQELQGEFHLTSQPGQGTTLVFTVKV